MSGLRAASSGIARDVQTESFGSGSRRAKPGTEVCDEEASASTSTARGDYR